MKKFQMFVLVFSGCLILILGCVNKNRIALQKRLTAMSDRELVNHYKMLEMRIIDIDREKENHLDRGRKNYPEKYYNHLGHLHIGDTWYELRKEKDLILKEINKRGISHK